MGLLQIRITRVGCRSIKGMCSERSEQPHIPVSLGYGLYSSSSFRLGRAVSAQGTPGQSEFRGCSECQGSLGQDFESPTIVSSLEPTRLLASTVVLKLPRTFGALFSSVQ